MKLLWLLPHLLLLLQLLWLDPVSSQLQCNAAASSRQKRIVLRNPAAKQLSELDSCRYGLTPWSAQVCQVRIDFEHFELPVPHLNATTQLLECSDFVQVQRFKLCGRNSGQHLYVQLQRGQTLELLFRLSSHSAQSTWQLTLTQIECPTSALDRTQQESTSALTTLRPMLPFLSNILPRTIFGNNAGPGPAGQLIQRLVAPSQADQELRAPLGCDQYWRSSKGSITSFNFAGGIYMPNTKYSICVAGGTNNEISYNIEHFALSKFSSSENGPGYDADCHSTIKTLGRASDYLLIPNSYVANNPSLQATYYCGSGIAGSNLIAYPPFIIHFSSDAHSSATETGFQLTYTVQLQKQAQSEV